MLTLKISEAEKKLQDRLQCLQYLATHTVEAYAALKRGCITGSIRSS